MIPFSLYSMTFAAVISTLISVKGMKKKSLSKMGALAAWIVGFLSISTGLRGFLIFIFYQLGSSATKFKKEIKEKLDSDASEGSVRGPHQVLACSIIAVCCGVIHAALYGEEKTIDFTVYPSESALTCCIIAHYACCCADTLASELGILAVQTPFLVTQPWRNVPRGTNGGITYLGLFWSALGGAIISLGAILLDWISGTNISSVGATIGFGSICGLIGSLMDSILGATVQASFYDEEKKQIHSGGGDNKVTQITGYNWLTNAQVNLVSVLMTTLLGGYVIGPILFT